MHRATLRCVQPMAAKGYHSPPSFFGGRPPQALWLGDLLLSTSRPKFPLVVIGLVALAASGCASSCGQSVLCAVRGPINDPSNYSLRRSILSMGLSEFCHQVTTHNAPLKLTEGAPVIGRFYPQHCVQRELPNGDLYVEFDGFGYAWTPLSKKVTFTMSGAVDYDQDFRIHDNCDIYAYFRTRNVRGSNFQSHLIEQPVASFLNSLSPMADNFGRQLVSGKLGEGFTVIREKSGNVDFGLGSIPLGQRPVHPFDVHGSKMLTYENLRTEVDQEERDFIGPIEVADSHRALYIQATMQGVPAIDLMLMKKEDADVSLGLYFNYGQAGPLNAPVMQSVVILSQQPFRQVIPVPKGSYYVVLDNTSSAGSVAPPAVGLLGNAAATVDYVVQLGDAP
jgi:hypothetical protein